MRSRPCSTPETYHIVNNTLDIGTRRNLAQVSKVITQITTGVEFNDEEGQNYVAINEYVRKAIKQVNPWVFEGTSAVIRRLNKVLTTHSPTFFVR